MRFHRTPLRQLERLYGSILRAVLLLANLSESADRQEKLIRVGSDATSSSIGSAQDRIAERIDAGTAQLAPLIGNVATVVNASRPRHEAEQYLSQLQQQLAASMPDNPATRGWRSYAQCDEDGIARECLRRVGQAMPLSKTLIEVGCADGLENNTHQLILDGFSGCWIDGDIDKIKFIETELGRLQTPALMVKQAFLTLDSIDRVIRDCRLFLATADIDYFSFDTDGNDTHLVRKTLEVITPKIICVEYNAKFRPPSRLEMDYSAEHRWGRNDYYGASIQTWVDLLDNYTLVSCNLSGVNAFFVRQDLAHLFTKYSVDQLFQPARHWLVGSGSDHPATLKWLRQAISRPQPERPLLIEARVPNLAPFEFEIHRRMDECISVDLARTSIWEPFETAVFQQLCRPGDFVLDLGGNIGWYSVLASKIIGPSGRLITFEPDPDNFQMLSRNIGRCTGAPLTELRHEAVGDHAGTVKLFLSERNLGDHRLFDDGTDRASISVPLNTLDSILGGEAHLPDIVKSDTQGSEARILAGARDLLSKGWRPTIVLEFWPFGLVGAGDSAADLWQYLVTLGYEMYEVSEGNPRLTLLTNERVDARLLGDISVASEGFINILAIPEGSDRLSGLRDLID